MKSNLAIEIWKPIPSLMGLYEASNLGRIRGVDRFVESFSARGGRPILMKRAGQIMSQSSKHDGYLGVSISWDGADKSPMVHPLVLEAFIGPRPDGMQACHNDGDRTNNRIENLRWDTALANMADLALHGTRLRGEQVGTAKLTPEAVMRIRSGLKRSVAMKEFGIGASTFHRIKNGTSWCHL